MLRDRWSVVQYWGVWFTDDSVNALALVTFYLRHLSWVTNALDLWTAKSNIILDQFGNIVDPNNLAQTAYQSYDYETTYNNYIY